VKRSLAARARGLFVDQRRRCASSASTASSPRFAAVPPSKQPASRQYKGLAMDRFAAERAGDSPES
jgi:hypothetical protein